MFFFSVLAYIANASHFLDWMRMLAILEDKIKMCPMLIVYVFERDGKWEKLYVSLYFLSASKNLCYHDRRRVWSHSENILARILSTINFLLQKIPQKKHTHSTHCFKTTSKNTNSTFNRQWSKSCGKKFLFVNVNCEAKNKKKKFEFCCFYFRRKTGAQKTKCLHCFKWSRFTFGTEEICLFGFWIINK